MQELFDEFEKLGLKSVLRFAYERDFNGRYAQGPTLDQALTHLDQLKPFFHKNKHLIHVVQAGIIGAWGEWHSSVHGLDQSDEAKKMILEKLLDVVPSDRAIQIRVPEYKNILKDYPELYKRLSFHDDMIIIQPHRWDGGMHEGTAYFDQMVAETPLLPMDGELPWGFWSIDKDDDSPDPGWIIDGHQAARRFFLQHFTSLSAIHNYLEVRGREGSENEIKYSMQLWKETTLDIEFLKENNMPISENYFQNRNGNAVNRNVFDYVRDHLGYRIELQEIVYPKEIVLHKPNQFVLSLINRGFSTIHNEYGVYFVLINSENEVFEFKTDANTFNWQPYDLKSNNREGITHQIESTLTFDKEIEPGTYRLGLWIPDGSEELKYCANYAIQCANDFVYWFVDEESKYGVNVLFNIEITE